MREKLLLLQQEVIGKLKAFQRATVARIDRIFRDKDNPQYRVLVADEVGLGKTMIARGVIANMAVLRHEENDQLFKVIYVCSNQAIARQNIRKLQISADNKIDNSVAETRLSMQHLRVLEQEAECQKDGIFIQLTPLTPGTSFQISNSQGSAPERALMYCILRRKLGDSDALSKFLCYGAEANWESYVDSFEKRIAKVANTNYPDELIEQLDKYADLLSSLQLHLTNGGGKNINLIVSLRRMFAELSAAMLQPDLVIMDEFQRFQSLLNPEDGSDLKTITDKFLRCDDSSDEPPRVLLLSATPYKLYSTLDEIDESQSDEHFAEFMEVVSFLLDHNADRVTNFKTIWQQYSRELQNLKNGIMPQLQTKECAENQLYNSGMCRTERISFVRDGDFLESIPEVLKVREGDILAFTRLSKALEKLKVPTKVPYEFVKSSPYLMSFMDNYQLKKLIEKRTGTQTAKEVLKGNLLWLKKHEINDYKAIPETHAKFECLRKYAFENHAERLLWIPPSMPYYEPQGIFKDAEDFSKLLIFSAWEMVPRMIASLISYDAECKTNGYLSRLKEKKEPDMGSLHYCSKDRFPRRKLFNRKVVKGQQEDNLSLQGEILRCGSEFLEDCFIPGKENLPLCGLKQQIGEKIAKALASLNISTYPVGKNPYCYVAGRLDGEADTIGVEHIDLPKDVITALTDMAIAAPGICIARRLKTMPDFDRQKIAELVKSILQMFDSTEGIGAVAIKLKDLDDYPRTVLKYCMDGNFQAMFDEYFFLLNPDGKEKLENVIEIMKMALDIRSASYDADTYDAFVSEEKSRNISFRSHYAVGFNKSTKDRKDSETTEATDRKESVRTAFNSPFRPFVLASTSVGQEGLDFHYYCRRIMHWNLPHNPTELEQREGRINRYMCLAVRRSMVEYFQAPEKMLPEWSWKNLMVAAENEAKLHNENYAELSPFWCFSQDQPVKIQRIVPLYPFSRDVIAYERLLKLLSLYRLTLGQARQEEILNSILARDHNADELTRELFISLCPFKKERQNIMRRNNVEDDKKFCSHCEEKL